MPGSRSPIATVGEALSAGREDVGRLLSGAEADACRVEASSAAGAQHEARRRLAEIRRVSDEIERQTEALEAAAARFAEVAATASAKLVELSEATDFSPPSVPEGLRGTVQEQRERAT